MKWIAKAFRHNKSLQIVIPKQIWKELEWGFNTHFVIEKLDNVSIVITSLDDWTNKEVMKGRDYDTVRNSVGIS